MTNKEKYKQAFSALHTSTPIYLEEITMKNTKTRIVFRPIAAVICIMMLFGSATVAYAADIGGIRQTIQFWIQGKSVDADVVDNGDGNYEFFYEDGNKAGGGGIAIENDGSKTPLSAEEVVGVLSNEVSLLEDGTVWLYYNSYAIDITDQMTDAGCKVVLNDHGQKVYFSISAPNELGSCAFSRTLSPTDDKDDYIPIN